jgi:phosphoglycerol geranylgeranyltransferase
MPLYGQINTTMINKEELKKSIALLIDPDDIAAGREDLLHAANKCGVDYILVGGSLTFNKPGDLIKNIKKLSDIPVYIFPGNLLQLDDNADGVLLLSLISGRNPELLIGNHVIAAPLLKEMKSDIVPVGYILVNCGSKTSVEYMSQTEAIPSGKPDIAVATAIAGALLGLKMIYLEAGSGASHPVPANLIKAVRENIDIPLIVGGGLKSSDDITSAFNAGADILVLGNGVVRDPKLLLDACTVRDSLNK